MIKNNGKASIREVFSLIEELRREFNDRIDNLENNHLAQLTERVDDIEKKLYWATGVVITIITFWELFLKLLK